MDPRGKQDDAAADPCREAAQVISDLLSAVALTDADFAHGRRDLYAWERDAFRWLAEQRRREPGTTMNLWTACRMRDLGFTAGKDGP